MRFLDLRRRLFLAMGVPLTLSCGGAQPAPEGGRIGIGVGTGDGAGDEVLSNVDDRPVGGPCGVDQVDEQICGATTPDACGAHGDSLTSYGASQLHVTQGSYGAHDPTFRDFALDPAATDVYQQSIAREGLPVAEYCCYSHCTALVVAATAPLDVPVDHSVQQRCIPAPEGGTRVPAAGAEACPGAVQFDGVMRPFAASGNGHCCYSVTVYEEPYRERHNRGRAARVDGAVVTAPVAAGRAWTATPRPALAGLDAALRAQLAAAWANTAQMEHASIASFSNLALRLIAVGAPPALIADTHRAALDEIEHARVAFALASAYGAAPVGPAAFPDAARLSAAGGLEALALETFVDGCIGETVAAVEARLAASRAVDPVVAAALAVIAEDETRHAELAWAIVAWCVRSSPTLLASLQTALAAEPVVAADAALAPDALAGHGVVSAHELGQLRRDVVRDVVTPCLRALSAPDLTRSARA